MQIITDTLAFESVRKMAETGFGDFVNAVVDVDRHIVAIDAELHSDLEAALMQEGSRPADVWGIHLYPVLPPGEWIEFDAMIYLRPSLGNRSRGVEDEALRARIVRIIEERIPR